MEPHAIDAQAPAAERPVVLLVDDEDIIRDVLRRILRRDHEVVEAASIADARARLAERAFGVVLCDIRMGGDSGLELLREILAGGADIAVVMVTGVDDPAVAEEALALGAYGYLLKPFTPNQVIITVASALRRREAETARTAAEERARLHQLVSERDRIATHLYSEVVHDLFAVSLALSGAAKLVTDAKARDRILDSVDSVDGIIKRIRSTILNPPETAAS